MLAEILRSFQLSKKESIVFLTTLEMGYQPASSIARICELPRNTTRNILEKLVKRHLMAKTKRANTHYYSVESKENLIQALELQKRRYVTELEDQISLLKKHGDELVSCHGAHAKPKITFYEGVSGLERVYEDTLTAQSDIRSWASFEKHHDNMPAYFKTYLKRRTERGIFVYSIHPDTQRAIERQQKLDEKELRVSRLVPKEKYSWTPAIKIYDNKINITSWKEKLGILIESEEIAKALSTLFDLSYEAALQYDQTDQPEAALKKKANQLRRQWKKKAERQKKLTKLASVI